MRILVDADACPVKKEILSVAQKHNIEVTMFFDTSHEYEDGYSTVVIVDKGRDAVDLALVNSLKSRDIVVTQDYGVAALALAKECYAVDLFGNEFTEFNIELKLNQRAHNQKLRKSGKRVKGPKKRVIEDNEQFLRLFDSLVSTYST